MVKNGKFAVQVNSEIGELEAVIIHSPGSEVENMTPENAERALYSDILNLAVAKKEYEQFSDILKKVTTVFEVQELLAGILSNEKVKREIINKICSVQQDPILFDYLYKLDKDILSHELIEGVTMRRDSLSQYLNPQRFSVRPLHNFFFTRDASMAIYDKVLVGKMASRVREREAQIMEAIFDYHPYFQATTINARIAGKQADKISIEGGDVLIAREDVILVGIGARTTPQGVDVLLENLKKRPGKQHIIVQELPTERESFIHLDMVFTFLSQNEVMVYEPVILQPNRYKTIHIEVLGDKVTIFEEENILNCLTKLGMDIKPISCGGVTDPWNQEREQWHSGANFFAIGPGKIIGYERNNHTLDELNKNGYEILKAGDILSGKRSIEDYKKYVIAIKGSELSRGGGGARCMTMPVRRKNIEW